MFCLEKIMKDLFWPSEVHVRVVDIDLFNKYVDPNPWPFCSIFMFWLVK